MKVESGTTMETGRNSAFRAGGSSDLPAAPGLMVMKTAQSYFRTTFASSKRTAKAPAWIAVCREMISPATSKSICGSILLNSSKQTHAPLEATPLKNLHMPAKS